MITRNQLIEACRDAGFQDHQWKALTFNSGPYDITEPSSQLKRLAEILTGRQYEEN